MNPNSPLYDERFDGYVKTMKVRSPFQFEIEFARVPLVIEGLLLAPPARRHPTARCVCRAIERRAGR